jgi:hypothetical protein
LITEEMRKYLSGNPYGFEKSKLLTEEKKGKHVQVATAPIIQITPDMRAVISGNPYEI